jgi:DNA-binding CsgD family transcriptional regulator
MIAMFDMRELHAAAASVADLTDRDREVLRLVGEGASPREIAARLNVSEETLYRLVGQVLDELAPGPDGETMAAVHDRHGSRPADEAELAEFERSFGTALPPDDEG